MGRLFAIMLYEMQQHRKQTTEELQFDPRYSRRGKLLRLVVPDLFGSDLSKIHSQIALPLVKLCFSNTLHECDVSGRL